MAIVKFCNRMYGAEHRLNNTEEALDYVMNPKKCYPQHIIGYGISVKLAALSMKCTQRIHKKTGGRDFVQIVISYKKDSISLDKAAEISYRFLKFYNEYQSIAATHHHTKNVHTHIILNTVNFCTGLKFSHSQNDLREFKEYVEQVLNDEDIEGAVIAHCLEYSEYAYQFEFASDMQILYYTRNINLTTNLPPNWYVMDNEKFKKESQINFPWKSDYQNYT